MARGTGVSGQRGMGVTDVRRLGPLWRWQTVRGGSVVARGFALTEKAAWKRSIRKTGKV